MMIMMTGNGGINTKLKLFGLTLAVSFSLFSLLPDAAANEDPPPLLLHAVG
jgi:hypothetical protein